MQYAKQHCSPATCAFVFKNRARLPALIDDIWRWESIDAVVVAANQTLMQALSAALSKPCICGGKWARFTAYALGSNRIDVPALCKSVMHSLGEGRSPAAPIVTLTGVSGGEGKSFFIKGLAAVVGSEHVFGTPTHPNFPLHGLEEAKLVILDEFRFTTSVVPLATVFVVQWLCFSNRKASDWAVFQQPSPVQWSCTSLCHDQPGRDGQT